MVKDRVDDVYSQRTGSVLIEEIDANMRVSGISPFKLTLKGGDGNVSSHTLSAYDNRSSSLANPGDNSVQTMEEISTK